jgi:ankyrin repeat protein
MVELLLINGADVQECQSALRIACRKGHMEILEAFLQRDGGVDIENTGPIALLKAIEKNREDIVNQLLDKGVKVNKSMWRMATLSGNKTLSQELKKHYKASLDSRKAISQLARFLKSKKSR